MLDTGKSVLSGVALSLFQQGLNFVGIKEYRKALKSYNRVLQLCDKCPDVWHERGIVLECLGDYEEAVLCYDQALHLTHDPNLAHELWYVRGNALQYGLGDFEAAVKSYDQALQIRSDYYLVWQNRGNALLYGLNQYTEAISNYDRALYLAPEYAVAWRNRGNALLELGRYQEAIDNYDQALMFDPNDQICHYARANATNQLGLIEGGGTTDPSWYGRGYNNPEQSSFPGQDFCFSETEQEVESELDEKDTLTPVTSVQLELLACTPILLIEDTQGSRELPLSEAMYSIGRDPSMDICLNSHYASRHHATLVQTFQTGEGYVYRIIDGDLIGKKSTNGLLINGRKQLSWDLNNRDEVILGPDVKLTYLARVQEDCSNNN